MTQYTSSVFCTKARSAFCTLAVKMSMLLLRLMLLTSNRKKKKKKPKKVFSHMEQNFLYKKVFFNTFMSSIQDGPNRHFGSLCSINNGPNPTAIQRFHFHENKCLYILRLNTGKWNTNSAHHELTFDKTL